MKSMIYQDLAIVGFRVSPQETRETQPAKNPLSPPSHAQERTAGRKLLKEEREHIQVQAENTNGKTNSPEAQPDQAAGPVH